MKALPAILAVLASGCASYPETGRIVDYCTEVHAPRQITAYDARPEELEALGDPQWTRTALLYRTARTLLTASHQLHEDMFPGDAKLPEIQAAFLRSMSSLFEPALRRRILRLAEEMLSRRETSRRPQFDYLLFRKWGVDYEDVEQAYDNTGHEYICIRELERSGKIWTGYVGFTELHFIWHDGTPLIREIVHKWSHNGEPMQTWRLSQSLPK